MRHLQIYQGAAQAIEFTEKGVIQERCVLCNTAVELCPYNSALSGLIPFPQIYHIQLLGKAEFQWLFNQALQE